MAAHLLRQIAFIKRKSLPIRIFRILQLSFELEDASTVLQHAGLLRALRILLHERVDQQSRLLEGLLLHQAVDHICLDRTADVGRDIRHRLDPHEKRTRLRIPPNIEKAKPVHIVHLIVVHFRIAAMPVLRLLQGVRHLPLVEQQHHTAFAHFTAARAVRIQPYAELVSGQRIRKMASGVANFAQTVHGRLADFRRHAFIA